MDYRVYLLDAANHCSAADNYVAADDSEATEIAAALQEVTADVFRGCEVWRGTKRVAALCPTPSNRAVKFSSALSLDARLIALPVRQEKLVKLEQQLRDSFECVKESRRLLETLIRLENIAIDQQLQETSSRARKSN